MLLTDRTVLVELEWLCQLEQYLQPDERYAIVPLLGAHVCHLILYTAEGKRLIFAVPRERASVAVKESATEGVRQEGGTG